MFRMCKTNCSINDCERRLSIINSLVITWSTLTTPLADGLPNSFSKGSLTQAFSFKTCEMFKSTFLYRTSPVTASVNTQKV